MALADALRAGQAAAERRMTDECVITRAGTEPVFNEETGQYDVTESTVYAGKCYAKAADALGSEQDAGDRFLIVNRVSISVPLGAVGVRTGDRVLLVSSAFNPQLAGARYNVRGLNDTSQTTRLVLQCEST